MGFRRFFFFLPPPRLTDYNANDSLVASFCLTFHSHCLKVYWGFLFFFFFFPSYLDEDEKKIFIAAAAAAYTNGRQESCDAIVLPDKERITPVVHKCEAPALFFPARRFE